MKTLVAAAAPTPKVNCRTIEIGDLDAVAKCLARGFPQTSLEYWRVGLCRLNARAGVDGFSKFGHCLEIGGEIVGVLLLIYSRRSGNGSDHIQCNLSSWCVDPEFRMFAPALSLSATKRKDVTYINISPAKHTRKGIETLGYERYVRGEQLFVPLLSRRAPKTSIEDWDEGAPAASLLPPREREILREHHAMGRRAFIGSWDGVAHGFVSSPSRVLKGKLRCEQILYFRDYPTLVMFAGAIGAHFLKELQLLFLVDANEPIEGLVGRHLPGRSPRYYRGPIAPRVGDLAYSELALLGEYASESAHADRFALWPHRATEWWRRLPDLGRNSGYQAKSPRLSKAVATDKGNVVAVEFTGGPPGTAGVSPARSASPRGSAAKV